MWAMVHRGTRNVGMRLSGRSPIDAIGVAGAKIPSAELLVSTPVPIAPWRGRATLLEVKGFGRPTRAPCHAA